MSNNNYIITEKKGYIGYVILNRPEKKNALRWDMYPMIGEAFDQMSADDDVRVIILKGNGPSFSAGFDLTDDGWQGFKELRRGYELQSTPARMKMWNCPKPTIAQVHGHVVGGAHDLAIMCDFCIAADNSKLGVPEIQFGLGMAHFMLPYVTHIRRAKELLLTGRFYTPEEGYEIGIINKVVPLEKLEEETIEFAKKLAVIPVPAMQLHKKTINHALEVMGCHVMNEIWLDYDCLGALWKDDQINEFNRQIEEKGLKGALKWRDEYFDNMMKQI